MSDEEVQKAWSEKTMLKPRIEKVTVNISVGRSGEPLEKAAKVLEKLAGQRPCKRKAKQTIREFGIRKGEPIACLVTLRGEKATSFLKKAFQAVDNKISRNCFDRHGNLSFGIREHIEMPDTKYEPELGIHGMDVSITLGRPGYRVKRRRHAKSKIGSSHLLTLYEAAGFIRDEFGVEVS